MASSEQVDGEAEGQHEKHCADQEMGTATTGMISARQEPRKRKMTTTTMSRSR
jgi:hypothetical protein